MSDTTDDLNEAPDEFPGFQVVSAVGVTKDAKALPYIGVKSPGPVVRMTADEADDLAENLTAAAAASRLDAEAAQAAIDKGIEDGMEIEDVVREAVQAAREPKTNG